MSLADSLSEIAHDPDGLSVHDIDSERFNVDAPIPEPDLTGSAWPMKGDQGYWFVIGWAGRHRRYKHSFWIVRCLHCSHEELARHGRLIRAHTKCGPCTRATAGVVRAHNQPTN